MKHFLTADRETYRNLEDRARGACVRFRNMEMPSCCHPSRADIGFEIQQDTGSASLFVSRGIHYHGNNPEIMEWLAHGVKVFPSFNALKDWLTRQLQLSYTTHENTGSSTSSSSAGQNHSTGPLTNIELVRERIKDLDKPYYLDENQLFERLCKHVIGQNAALRALSATIARHYARVNPSRPAVLFAVGPSGVGKTRTAEMLTKALAPSGDREKNYLLLRLDMNEYQEAHRVSQLLGAPQGYVGHGEGSQLLDALRSNPGTIILFDEIEKAHPSILRVLMNAMDAGRLSGPSQSSEGREVDCRQAVFFFTSNLKAKDILEEIEARRAFGNRPLEDEICRRRLHASGIAPEIVGRIGRFLIYRTLTPETRASILSLSIAEAGAEFGLNVKHISPDVIVELMRHASSNNFGVRPERYLIDDMLGELFMQTAAGGTTRPVRIEGPPFTCKPCQSGSSPA